MKITKLALIFIFIINTSGALALLYVRNDYTTGYLMGGGKLELRIAKTNGTVAEGGILNPEQTTRLGNLNEIATVGYRPYGALRGLTWGGAAAPYVNITQADIVRQMQEKNIANTQDAVIVFNWGLGSGAYYTPDWYYTIEALTAPISRTGTTFPESRRIGDVFPGVVHHEGRYTGGPTEPRHVLNISADNRDENVIKINARELLAKLAPDKNRGNENIATAAFQIVENARDYLLAQLRGTPLPHWDPAVLNQRIEN